MSNSIANITTSLTEFGREFLPALKKALLVAGMVPRGENVEIRGGVATYPDLDIPSEASTRSSGGAATASDIVATTRSLSVQHIYQGVKFDNFDDMISSPKLVTRLATRLGYNVAAKFDKVICSLWNEWPYEVGEIDGTGAFNATDKILVLAQARKVLKDNLSPDDGLIGMFNTQEALNLRSLDQLLKVNEAGSSSMLRSGGLGSLMGFDLFESQQVQSATLSAAAASSSPGSINNGAGYPIGTTSVVMAGLGSGTLKKGTSFTIAGTNTYRYVATADATISGNGATVSIYPALKEAVVDTAAVVFTEHSAACSQNFLFHPDAFSSIMVAGPALRGGVDSVVVSDEQTGLSVRLSYQAQVLGDAGAAFTQAITADLYGGAKTTRPEWVVRATGQV